MAYFRDLAANCRLRARKADVPCDITWQYLHSIWTDACPILGVKIRQWGGHADPANASLDRIIPERGYVVGNVCFLSNRANRIKQDGTAAEHRAIAAYMDKFAKDQ